MDKTLPDFIADELIARIYIGTLQPGDRLPPERQLAETLSVDRTSLRMALRTLNRMHLILPVRGSGITVLDYRKHAGLDFLTAILAIPELELGTDIKLQSVAAFNNILSGLIHQLVRGRIAADLVETVRDLLQLQRTLLEAGPLTEALLDRVAELELQLQDVLLGRHGGLVLELMSNSTRPLRAVVIRELFGVIDVRAYVCFHQELIILIGTGSLAADQVGSFYQKYAQQLTEPLQARYRASPLLPRLRVSPLQVALARQPALS